MSSPKDQSMDFVKVVNATHEDRIRVVGCCLDQNPKFPGCGCLANLEDKDYIIVYLLEFFIENSNHIGVVVYLMLVNQMEKSYMVVIIVVNCVLSFNNK